MSDKQKITLVGPIEPFRGGIAQYNTQLQKALDNVCDLQTISFKRQYPKWLYPGKGDTEPGGRNLQDVSYILDAYSPLSLKKTVKQILEFESTTVVLTWWTLFWQPGFAYMAWKLKKKGVKTVFLCHNIFDHDSNPVVQKISKFLLRQSDLYVVNYAEDKRKLQAVIEKPRVINLQSIPIYTNYPAPTQSLKKRGRLEILFFGFIRPYKGLEDLVDALCELKDKDIYLTIAGETWGKMDDIYNKIKSSELENNVDFNITYVDNKQAANLFERADVLALPYKSATGSAVASLAYFYKKPILATNVGGLKDVVSDGETGWIVKPNSPHDLAKTIQKITRKDANRMVPAIEKFCAQNSWESLAIKIAAI